MNDITMALPAIGPVAGGVGAGLLLAWLHFATLAANVRLYLAPGTARRAVGLHLFRLLVVVTAFGLAATAGAPVLLATLAGFSLGRLHATRHYR